MKRKDELKLSCKDKEYSINDLFKSIKVRHYFNKIDFDKFYTMVYKHIDFKLMSKEKMTKKDWDFTGLMNTDFLMMFCDEVIPHRVRKSRGAKCI
jgi:hypothetical protein